MSAVLDPVLLDSECPIAAIVATEAEDEAYAKVNLDLTPTFKENPPAAERPKNDPPRRSDNTLVN